LLSNTNGVNEAQPLTHAHASDSSTDAASNAVRVFNTELYK